MEIIEEEGHFSVSLKPKYSIGEDHSDFKGYYFRFSFQPSELREHFNNIDPIFHSHPSIRNR